MQTKIWRMPAHKPDEELLEEAASFLKKGELVAFPTETVYGLGGNALDSSASRKIYEAKGRPSDNPLIVHISDINQIDELVRSIPPVAIKLMEKFWPGPITFVLPKSDKIPAVITGGLDTVAIRMPAHKIALKLIEIAGLPIAAPSANISGRPSPTTAQHVIDDLGGKIAGIIDGGKAGVGVESTVLDLTTPVPTILRPGGVTLEDLQKEIGEVHIDKGLIDANHVPRSPGMKYTHYSPEADVIIVKGSLTEMAEKILKITGEELGQGKKVGLMVSQELYELLKTDLPGSVLVEILGKKNNLAQVTSNLFMELRALDKEKVDVIYVENFPETYIGAALMNRLYKAAGGKTV